MYSYKSHNHRSRNLKSKFGPNTSPLVNVLLLILRLIFGGVFVFSGFVKLVDPLGFTYKIQDYLFAFGGYFEAFIPFALPVAIACATAELVIGLNMIFKIRVRLSILAALLFMLGMTLLTLYIAIKNPVSDCGCFGDALIISNTETFVKNLFLLAIIIILYVFRKRMYSVFAPVLEWIILLLFVGASVLFSLYNYHHLPIVDFRPYKIGVNIPEAMSIPKGYPQDEYNITFIYEKEGVQKEFTLENYPKNDSTWIFVDQKSTLIKKGYEPPIHDFIIEDENLDDITYDVLSHTGYTYLIIAYDISKAPEKELMKVQQLYDRVEHSKNTTCYVLTSSSDDEIEKLRKETGISYPFYKSDPITLKTIVRANPGIVLIKDGTIVGKWHWRDFEWQTQLSSYK